MDTDNYSAEMKVNDRGIVGKRKRKKQATGAARIKLLTFSVPDHGIPAHRSLLFISSLCCRFSCTDALNRSLYVKAAPYIPLFSKLI